MHRSELILNPRGSIYHLDLLPHEIASNVITVGDPQRVRRIAQHLDLVEFEKQKREFLTITGFYKGLRLSLISTGIGTDNVDIVLNELDALWNIDLTSGRIKDTITQSKLLRLGTTGSLQNDLKEDGLIFSSYALGADGLMEYYEASKEDKVKDLEQRYKLFIESMEEVPHYVYGAASADSILSLLSPDINQGITLTAKGFYGPQGRSLGRLSLSKPGLVDALSDFSFDGLRLTNLEMESAGLLALSQALGHEAASLSVVLANRKTSQFSQHPQKAIDHLIEVGLELMYQWSQD